MKDDTSQEQTAQGVVALTAWAASPQAREISSEAMRKAALVFADNLAALIAAQDEPEVQAIHKQLVGEDGGGRATVFSHGMPKAGRMAAALANGIACSWCELDEGYRLAPCHAGLLVQPALMAEAEVLSLSTGELLQAMAIAYEVTARIARCWVFPQLTLHPHPQTAAIGGAMAVAAARRFDAASFHAALTAASTLTTLGSFSHAVGGALVRNVWSAIGTVNGMRMADWTALGIGGMKDSPWSVYTQLLGQAPNPPVLTAGLGQEWAIANGYHKIHACCQSTHSAVEAMVEARAALPEGASHHDVTEIHLASHRPGMTNPDPPTSLAAKFSFAHVLATVLVHGHADQPAFSASVLNHPDIARLRHAVRLTQFEPALPRPHDRPARLKLVLRDGRQVHAQCLSARGGPDRPWEAGVIEHKIRQLTATLSPRLADTLLELTELPSALLAKPWGEILNEALD